MSAEDKQIEIKENKEPDEENNEQTKKKSRTFYTKDFCQQLKTRYAYNSIKEFVQLCDQENAQDYALEFIENNGNCLHILRVLDVSENKNASYVLPIFEAFSIVLLKIIVHQPQKQYQTENTCRELLNKHTSIMKSMLGLNSNKTQRLSVLKLLTAMVTLSPNLGKEILLHMHFDESVLKVLINPNIEDGNSVRNRFIQFLISFIINDDPDVINIFLKKRFLLQSIFSHMIYDNTEIINIVLSTLQKHILENDQVSKTTKMYIFSHKTIQHIINLFNWKGPKSWNVEKKKESVQIIAEDKQLVCEIAHQFLLVLCASRYGVVFFDPNLGLKNSVQNLMSNVLKSLSKPWNNPFSSDLVIQICAFSPDLVQEVFSTIESFLEIRVSNYWLNVIHFIKTLIEKLNFERIQKYFINLSPKQLFSCVQTFCAPQVILNIIPSGCMHDHFGIRNESVSLLLVILNATDRFLSCVNSLPQITSVNKSNLKESVVSYLLKNVPAVSLMLNDWQRNISSIDESDIPIPEETTYLNTLLSVLNNYQILCPELIDQFKKDYDINEFLKNIQQVADENTVVEIHIKVIQLLMSGDSFTFYPSKDLFSYAFPLLLKVYYESSNHLKREAENLLVDMLAISEIFEGCNHEIKILLYSILEFDAYDESFGKFLTDVIKELSKNVFQYNSELSSLIDTKENNSISTIANFLKTKSDNKSETEIIIKHKTLSPLVIGLLDGMLRSKNLDICSNVNTILINLLFSQTSPKLFISALLNEKYKSVISKYLTKDSKHDIFDIERLKELVNSKTLFSKLLNFILTTTDETDFISNLQLDTSWRYYYDILFLNFIMYFYTEKVLQQTLSRTTHKKCLQCLEYIINLCDDNTSLQNCLNSILRHPVLLETFTPTYDSKQTIENMCTEFVIHITEEILKKKTKDDLEIYFSPFRLKLIRTIHIILNKNESKLEPVGQLIDVIKLFDLNFEQCSEILKIISELPFSCFVENNNSSVIPKILNYILSKDFNLKPFDDEVIKQISNSFIKLNESYKETNFEELENGFYNYIIKFPHVHINFNVKLFDSLLLKQTVHKSTINLATILLKYNKVLIKHVKLHLFSIIENRELIFSLADVLKDFSFCQSVQFIITKVYKKYTESILKFVNKPQKIPNYLMKHYSVISVMIDKWIHPSVFTEIVDKVQKYDVTEDYHVEVLCRIFIRIIKAKEYKFKKNKTISNFIFTMIHLLINALKRNEKSEEDWKKIENISENFYKYMLCFNTYSDDMIFKNTAFLNFSKLCLKFGLQGKPILIKVLKQICLFASEKNESLGNIFEMAISHSESLNILLSENELKTILLDLLLCLCKKCPSVMTKSHIPIWLGAYGATLSESDQYILHLLMLYEQANIGFHEYKPYLWGTAAVTHYSVLSGGANHLWKRPTTRDVVDIFNEEKIMRTVVHFPQNRTLIPKQVLYSKGELDVYDPAFYLPLLSNLMAPESASRWYNFSNRSIITLVIICLSSNSAKIREAAFHVLERFHNQLIAATRAKQRILWQRLVEAICLGTATLTPQKLNSIAAVFLCQCAVKFTSPSDILYKPLVNYINAKACPNFKVVPDLLEMFFNTSIRYKVHKIFILKVIRHGLKSKNDVMVMVRSMGYKLIMDFYNSTLANQESKQIILEILAATVAISTGESILISNYSLFSWLQSVLYQLNAEETDIIIAFINILFNFVKSEFLFSVTSNLQKVLSLFISMIDILKNSHVELSHAVEYIKFLYLIYEKSPQILTKTHLSNLIEFLSKFFDCDICNYYLEFGVEFIKKPILSVDDKTSVGQYYLQLLMIECIKSNEN